MIRLALVTLALVAGYSAAAAAAEAHQSGCHRWHSCPSDTGSYVCGDLGYACQYPSSPTLPDPDPPELPDSSTDPPLDDPPEPLTSIPDPLEEERERDKARSQARLDRARARLGQAQVDLANAESRRQQLTPIAALRRRRADWRDRRARRAEDRAERAEAKMVSQRTGAREWVKNERAAYAADRDSWLGNKVGGLALAVALLLMAFSAAFWRRFVSWLSARRERGWTTAGYSYSTLGGCLVLSGVVTVTLLSVGTLRGLLAPLAIPIIALLFVLLAVGAWHAAGAAPGVSRFSLGLGAFGRPYFPYLSVGVPLIAGVALAVTALVTDEPEKPTMPVKTVALAALAETDPSARPTKQVAGLQRKADRSERLALRASARASSVENDLDDAVSEARSARKRISKHQRSVDRWQNRVDNPQAAGGGTTGGGGGGSGSTPPRGPTGADGGYNCDDFDTQQQAQNWMDENGDVDGLDGDGDGSACQGLP